LCSSDLKLNDQLSHATSVNDNKVKILEEQLADKRVRIDLTDDARKLLAEKGYDKLNGARPLARIIQEQIKKPLAEEILYGRLTKGGRVTVGLHDGDFKFEFSSVEKKALQD
jgi:ATP-dependent Clp protease ATP-binding subunit ClpA